MCGPAVTTARNGPRCPHHGRKPNPARRDVPGSISPKNVPEPSLSLGPIDGTGNRVEVANSLWINGLAGQWLTYVVEWRGGTWEVTGTTGPMAIS
jgi:hypothetical protein